VATTPDGSESVAGFFPDDVSASVFPGDDYMWLATFKFRITSLADVTAAVKVGYLNVLEPDVPEPALGAMLIGGLVAVGLASRRNR
jgi:hypothetical protein